MFSRTLKNLKAIFPEEIQWISICKTTTTQCEGFPWNHRQELNLIIYVPLGKSRDEVGGWGWDGDDISEISQLQTAKILVHSLIHSF